MTGVLDDADTVSGLIAYGLGACLPGAEVEAAACGAGPLRPHAGARRRGGACRPEPADAARTRKEEN